MKTAMVCVAGMLLMTGMVGCLTPQKEPTTPPPTYTQKELIEKVDKNTENLKRFRSKGGRMTCKILTDKGLKQYDLDGVVVLLESPRNMYLSGGFLGHPALQIGSNGEKYWLGVMHDPSKLYWGYWKFADADCNEWKLGGPMKLMEAIGQVDLQNLEGRLIGPALQRTKEANILIYLAVDASGNWYMAKEIFLSLYEPIVVNKIVYYNPDGSEYLIISFFEHKQQSGPGTLMAKRVELSWPADQGYMKLTLGKPRLEKSFPEAAFVMPDPETFNEATQVDSKCK